MSFSCSVVTQWQTEDQSVAEGGVCKRYGGIGFPYDESRHFAELTITLQGSATEMPVYFDTQSNYTIVDVDVKSVILKTSGSERICDCNVDRIGRQHNTATVCNWKTVYNAQVPIGVIVMC